jgi:ribosomal protein S2
MKLNYNKKNYTKIFKIYIIKSKMYECSNKLELNSFSNKLVTQITVNLKKSLSIIHSYHKKNFKILFIGPPKTINKKINSKTMHTAISGFNNDFINNSLKLNKHFNTSKKYNLSNMKTKPKLIVIFHSSEKQKIINQSQLFKIPVIEFSIKKTKFNSTYNIPIEIKKNNTVFFSIINSLLNKLY